MSGEQPTTDQAETTTGELITSDQAASDAPADIDAILYATALYNFKTARAAYRRELNAGRPAIVLSPVIQRHTCLVTGDVYYSATYDDLIAVGDTPDLAYHDFDDLWLHGEPADAGDVAALPQPQESAPDEIT
jgi:hypothetical protein